MDDMTYKATFTFSDTPWQLDFREAFAPYQQATPQRKKRYFLNYKSRSGQEFFLHWQIIDTGVWRPAPAGRHMLNWFENLIRRFCS